MHNNSFSKNLKFSVIKDIETAKDIWEYFSPHDEIDDEWDFRYAFYKYLQFPLHFIVGYDGIKPIGLLPLQVNTGKGPTPQNYVFNKNFVEFFGGDDMDSNKVFLKSGYEGYLTSFLQQIHDPAVLAPLASQYKLNSLISEEYTTKYIVDLQKCTNFRDFLQQQFDGKSRSKLVNQLNKLQKNYKVEVKDAAIEDLELLFDYNKKRFGEFSSFQWEYRKQVFRDLSEQYDHDIFKIIIGGEIKAVSFSLLYKNTYLSMNIGYDYSIRDLGKFAVSTQFERAITLGCKVYDGGKGDSGWKEQFHLERIPQYILTIPNMVGTRQIFS